MKILLKYFITTKIADATMIVDIAYQTPGADKFAIPEAIGHDACVGQKYLLPEWRYGALLPAGQSGVGRVCGSDWLRSEDFESDGFGK
jgi:hypothetical protein